jgi:NAD(P)-dependent dehydrogenase (short-subunit alcohol dehydrogenase family)
VIVGSGPGIGSHVAALFAQKGFQRVILMSRNVTRLRDDAMIVRSAVPRAIVETVSVDLADTQHVERALKEVDRRLAGMAPECIVFNAARSGVSKMPEWPTEGFQRDLQVSVTGYARRVGRAHIKFLVTHRYPLSACTQSFAGRFRNCSGSPTETSTNQRCSLPAVFYAKTRCPTYFRSPPAELHSTILSPAATKNMVRRASTALLSCSKAGAETTFYYAMHRALPKKPGNCIVKRKARAI